MELCTYVRINAKDTGQFERTLLIAEDAAYVSYLEGCTAPIRDENQLHAAVVELVAIGEGSQIKYSTVQNWYPGDKEGKGGIYNFVPPAAGAARGHKVVDAALAFLVAGISVLHGRVLDLRVFAAGDALQPSGVQMA